MKITHDANTVIVFLPKECLIFEVEGHLDLAVGAFWNAPEVEEVIIDAGAVEVMDTAYFQLVLAIRRSVQERGKPCTVRNQRTSVKDIAVLYGISL